MQSRPDRWNQADQEFKRVGIQVDPFFAHPHKDKFQSFCRSQLAMVKEGIFWGQPTITFEDDAVFKDCGHLPAALDELPQSWDVLYLGANVTEDKPERYSKHLFRIRAAWTTHAVAYSPNVMDFISRTYKPETDGMYDDWLSKVVLQKFNGFIVAPMVCWQRKGFSDLWDRPTDYEPAFAHSNQKLV